VQLHLVGFRHSLSPENEIDWSLAAVDVAMLRDQYRCPHFCILVIGRANAGKTTILEKVCGVEKGTKPIIIHDKNGELNESLMYLLIFCSL
jgi:hypothetical protein